MEYKFIDNDWIKLFQSISRRTATEYKFITPFIQLRTIKEILKNRTIKFKLITRYNLQDFYDGVSSLDALKFILNYGGQIKGIKNLHSKLYIFDSKESVLASANLTQAALLRNFEFGMHTTNIDATYSMEAYFDYLWNKIPSILELEQIEKWQKDIDSSLQKGKDSYRKNKLKDHGFVIGRELSDQDSNIILKSYGSSQYFIKFFGVGNNRADNNKRIIDEVKRSGCHWACSYPTNKKPRSVKDGAIMFMGHLVSNPNDIMIHGYAIGNKYKDIRDDASDRDLKIRPWKKEWSRYIRVHDAKFIDGVLKDGVSMNSLMNKFDYRSFVSTLRHKIEGKGNINPRKAYSQQASVQLTPKSAKWLMEELEYRLKYIGRISNSRLSKID
ncbi:phospholipase D family protein [Thermodesulfobacteriota bacterium]